MEIYLPGTYVGYYLSFGGLARASSWPGDYVLCPQQFELALLPSLLDTMVLDLRFTGEFSGYNKPELDDSLILGS